MIGKKFGQIEVLSESSIKGKVTCRCSCGKIKDICAYSLKTGATVSCGCKKRAATNYKKLIEIQGKKIGRITPINISHINSNGDTYWNCICDCGNKVKIRRDGLINALKNNIHRGCGCIAKEMARQRLLGKTRSKSDSWKGHGEIAGSYISRMKSGAKRRNLEFSITIEQIWNLFLKQNRRCTLSGLNLTLPMREKDRSATASLDRIDSTKGYTEGNVQWIHKDLQSMKMDKTDREFIEYCYTVSQYNYPVALDK